MLIAAARPVDFTPVGAVFDGTNDYATATIAGLDSTMMTLSAWFFVAALGSARTLFDDPRSGPGLTLTNTNLLQCEWKNTGSTSILRVDFGTISTTGWHHVILSCDITNTSKRHAYLDDSAAAVVWNTYNGGAGSFGLNGATYGLGATSGGTQKLAGGLAELFHMHGQYMDLSVAANRQKFRGSDGHPVDLGTTGDVPFGTAPHIYLSIRDGQTANEFVANRGTGGNFTLTGALALASTNP